jgi:hypothetical protein
MTPYARRSQQREQFFFIHAVGRAMPVTAVFPCLSIKTVPDALSDVGSNLIKQLANHFGGINKYIFY